MMIHISIITYPGAVMVESIDAVITQRAVGGAWGAEYLASVTILELDWLPADQHLLRARGRPQGRGITRIGNL